jgi:hypothetical protein
MLISFSRRTQIHGVSLLRQEGTGSCSHLDSQRLLISNSAPLRYVMNTAKFGLKRLRKASYRNLKVKLSLCLTKHHATKTCWESGCMAPRILDLGTRWRRVVSFTSQPLYPQGKSPWYPLVRRLGGPQNRFGHGGGEKNSHPPPGIES